MKRFLVNGKLTYADSKKSLKNMLRHKLGKHRLVGMKIEELNNHNLELKPIQSATKSTRDGCYKCGETREWMLTLDYSEKIAKIICENCLAKRTEEASQ